MKVIDNLPAWHDWRRGLQDQTLGFELQLLEECPHQLVHKVATKHGCRTRLCCVQSAAAAGVVALAVAAALMTVLLQPPF